jgi:hypothetical protein
VKTPGDRSRNVETTGGRVQGCTISLIGCGASGAYAPGPDEEEEVTMMPVNISLFCQPAAWTTYTVTSLKLTLNMATSQCVCNCVVGRRMKSEILTCHWFFPTRSYTHHITHVVIKSEQKVLWETRTGYHVAHLSFCAISKQTVYSAKGGKFK